jgi:osmoprotectant transport system permease protein
MLRDAARGMGMTGVQILWHVELPLAMPVVLAGVRSAAVYASGMVVIASLVGAGGLGDYVFNGISRADAGLIWLGALPVLAFTLFLFWALGGVVWLSRKNSTLGMALGGALIVLLSAYAVGAMMLQAMRPARTEVRVGAKDFTEGQILSQIVKQMLEAHTDLRVEVQQNLGTSVILKAINSGEIDLYPEYTGVLLTSKEAVNLPMPKDRAAITGLVREEMHKRFGLVLLEPFGLNNTYAPTVTRATAKRHGLRTISDLQRTPQLRVVIDLSFRTRPDGWDGLMKHYGLHFNEQPSQVSPDLLYRALEKGAADLVIGFATDWQIQKLDLVVLDDDRGYFPSYHAAPLVREALLKQHPEVATVLNKLAGRIDDRAMRQLNLEVAVERRSEAEVARAFLRKQGLLSHNFQIHHREILAVVRPDMAHRKPTGDREAAQVVPAVLVRVFAADRFPFRDCETFAADTHTLIGSADEMHLDTARRGIVKRVVPEAIEAEIAVQLAIDARQQIEVEGRRYACAVVVRGVQDRRVLLEIGAQQQAAPGPA